MKCFQVYPKHPVQPARLEIEETNLGLIGSTNLTDFDVVMSGVNRRFRNQQPLVQSAGRLSSDDCTLVAAMTILLVSSKEVTPVPMIPMHHDHHDHHDHSSQFKLK